MLHPKIPNLAALQDASPNLAKAAASDPVLSTDIKSSTQNRPIEKVRLSIWIPKEISSRLKTAYLNLPNPRPKSFSEWISQTLTNLLNEAETRDNNGQPYQNLDDALPSGRPLAD